MELPRFMIKYSISWLTSGYDKQPCDVIFKMDEEEWKNETSNLFFEPFLNHSVLLSSRISWIDREVRGWGKAWTGIDGAECE